MTSKKQTTQEKKIKIELYRPEQQKRVYSNFVEVTTTEYDVSLRFADVKPARSEEEKDQVHKEGKVTIPVSEEILLQKHVAVELLNILQNHLEVSEK